MSWQSWAANELNQVAIYPSPYVNVHKGNMNTMGGSIGLTCLLKCENLAIELNVVSVYYNGRIVFVCGNFQNVRLLSVVGSCQKDDFKI